jgi:hypothetical protein
MVKRPSVFMRPQPTRWGKERGSRGAVVTRDSGGCISRKRESGAAASCPVYGALGCAGYCAQRARLAPPSMGARSRIGDFNFSGHEPTRFHAEIAGYASVRLQTRLQANAGKTRGKRIGPCLAWEIDFQATRREPSIKQSGYELTEFLLRSLADLCCLMYGHEVLLLNVQI